MNTWWEGYFFWEEQRLGELYAHFLLFIGKSCHLINPSKTKVLFCLFACPCSTEQQPYLLIWLLLLLSVVHMCLIPQFQNYFPVIKISCPCNFLTAVLLGSEPLPWNWKESPLCWPEEKKSYRIVRFIPPGCKISVLLMKFVISYSIPGTWLRNLT